MSGVTVSRNDFGKIPSVTLRGLVLPPSSYALKDDPVGMAIGGLKAKPVGNFDLCCRLRSRSVGIARSFARMVTPSTSLSIAFTAPISFSSMSRKCGVGMMTRYANRAGFTGSAMTNHIVGLSPTLLPFRSGFRGTVSLLG